MKHSNISNFHSPKNALLVLVSHRRKSKNGHRRGAKMEQHFSFGEWPWFFFGALLRDKQARSVK